MSDSNPATGLARVAYRERQSISHSDLDAEQQFLIGTRRRHNLAQHDWGIVQGLRVTDEFGVIALEPGLAIDGYGRELMVPEEVQIPPSYLVRLDADLIAAWLTYGLVDEIVCGGGSHRRVREESRIRLKAISSIQELDPRRPPDVPVNQASRGAVDSPPDDPAVQWPVLLGIIRRHGPVSFSVDDGPPDLRPYAGPRGQAIAAPSGSAQVQIGAEVSVDSRAFAVSLLNAEGKMTERFSVDADGNSAAHSDVTIRPVKSDVSSKPSNLIIQRASSSVVRTTRVGLAGCEEAGSDETAKAWGVVFGSQPEPKTAVPWHVYRALVQPPEGSSAKPTNEMRFEFADPGKKGNRKASRFSIGHRDKDGKFVPCLSVDAECTVTVWKKLVVKGKIILGPIPNDPRDSRFQQLLLASWLGGVVTGSNQVSSLYGATMSLRLTVPDEALVGAPIVCPVTLRNTGNSLITGVRVTLTTTRPNVDITLPAPIDRLEAGAEVQTEITLKVPTRGGIGLEVTASGMSDSGKYAVTASSHASLTIVEEANIETSIEGSNDGVVNTDVNYSAVVQNPGPAILTHVSVVETVARGGTPDVHDLLVDGVLLVGEHRRFARTARRSTPGDIVIKVDAHGFGSGSHNIARDSATKTITIHEAARITVAMEGLANGGMNTIRTFKVTITNLGSEAVRVAAIDAHTSPSHPGTFSGIPAPGNTINAGESFEVNAGFRPTATGSLHIVVNVEVTGPGGDKFSKTDSQTADIT